MFRFEHPEHLFFIALLPLLAIVFAAMLGFRRKALARFGNAALLSRLMPHASRYKDGIKFALLLVALLLLLVAWANPQWGLHREKAIRKSVDVFVALDVSNSMLAQDIAPNRLERAKSFALKLINGLKGDRIGIIIFAGNAYMQMPLTTDYAAAQLFIRSANPEMVPTQGTAIGAAIELGERSFEKNNRQHKAMVLLSDGETHDEDALAKAKKAREEGVLLFTVGCGTSEGAFIPLAANGYSEYKRDASGEPVRSKVNERMLRDLARAGEGGYFNLLDGDKILPTLRSDIGKIEKREFEQRIFDRFESYFQYFLLGGIVLVVLEFFMSYRKTPWLDGKDWFSK
jgi:Ca-activated chloride channel family protein